jgi:hypothetical protein
MSTEDAVDTDALGELTLLPCRKMVGEELVEYENHSYVIIPDSGAIPLWECRNCEHKVRSN